MAHQLNAMEKYYGRLIINHNYNVSLSSMITDLQKIYPLLKKTKNLANFPKSYSEKFTIKH